MKTVCNATPIISLASVKKLDILKEVFHTVIIPEAVYKEIKAKKGYGYKEVESDFIKVECIRGKIYSELLFNQMDLGETETIILAKEIEADCVIIDDNIAYKTAAGSGLNVTRTLSVLLRAKEKGIIREIKPLLDEMISKGRWYSKRVYSDFLKRINEL